MREITQKENENLLSLKIHKISGNYQKIKSPSERNVETRNHPRISFFRTNLRSLSELSMLSLAQLVGFYKISISYCV